MNAPQPFRFYTSSTANAVPLLLKEKALGKRIATDGELVSQ